MSLVKQERQLSMRGIATGFRGTLGAGVVCALAAVRGLAQNVPIAIVPIEGVKLSGAMNVADGKAVIGANGEIEAGERTAVVTLPHRGNLHICATTKVSLTSDSTVQSTEAPGLMLGLDRGAIEANFATGKNSDLILTPDLRILISGPGIAAVRVRLGDKGDTCIENRGPEAPYVLVSSNFNGGAYRVQQDQRVLFEHGSVQLVVDNEKESCGCPPDPVPASLTQGNAFPEAQSAGLTPGAPAVSRPSGVTATLSREEAQPAEEPAAELAAASEPVAAAAPKVKAAQAPKSPKKPGLFSRIGKLFRSLFGG